MQVGGESGNDSIRIPFLHLCSSLGFCFVSSSCRQTFSASTRFEAEQVATEHTVLFFLLQFQNPGDSTSIDTEGERVIKMAVPLAPLRVGVK